MPMMGMKVPTIWMPVPKPSAMTVISHSGAPMDDRAARGASTKRAAPRMSKKSMNAPPRLMVSMNIR